MSAMNAPPPGAAAPADELGRAILLDLSAWLGAWPGPVPAGVSYALEPVRGVEGGRARLARYLPPELLRRWEAALGPLLAGGGTVDVRLDALFFEASGTDGGRVEFTDITGGAARRWRLEIRTDAERRLVRDAWFTRLDS